MFRWANLPAKAPDDAALAEFSVQAEKIADTLVDAVLTTCQVGRSVVDAMHRDDPDASVAQTDNYTEALELALMTAQQHRAAIQYAKAHWPELFTSQARKATAKKPRRRKVSDNQLMPVAIALAAYIKTQGIPPAERQEAYAAYFDALNSLVAVVGPVDHQRIRDLVATLAVSEAP